MTRRKGVQKVSLDRDEEKIAQLLTRDAWRHLNQTHIAPSPFSTSKIPRMPVGGYFEFVADSEVLRYYLSQADRYQMEMAGLGWSPKRYGVACKTFREKIAAACRGPGGMNESPLMGV